MRIFEFNKQIIEQVIKELAHAKEYIKIAVFQIHNRELFAKLNEKLSQGVRVELFTLPYNSIHDSVRDEVIANFEALKKKGAEVFFCKWNVGDPERTTTAVGVWYSFHGKFIVTDQSAISLSANLTQQAELDAMLLYRQEPEKIKEFNNRFEELKELFVVDNHGYEGNIRQRILDSENPKAAGVFFLPKVIPSGVHDRTWIQEYPPELCPEDAAIEERLYIVPFDVRSRNFLMKMINEAEKFVYISAESFTDKEFPNFLKRVKLKGVDLRILAGAKSMDYTDRMQQFMKELIAVGIQFHTTSEELHAKLIVTDKLVAISSVNLNNINLGFRRTGNFWRANTETITVCRDSEIIKTAMEKFLAVFDSSIDIADNLAEKSGAKVSKIFTSIFNVRSSKGAKELLAKLSILRQIDCEKYVIQIAKYSVMLKERFRLRLISEEHILMAAILYHLTERKHELKELSEKLAPVSSSDKVSKSLDELIAEELIIKEDEFFKINLAELLSLKFVNSSINLS